MKLFLITLGLIFSSQSIAQNNGLFGKKTFVEFNGQGCIPVFGWFLNETGTIYKSEGKTLLEGRDNFNYGFRAVLGRVITRNTALSLELGYDYSNIAGPEYVSVPFTDQWGYSYTQYLQLKHEMYDITTFAVMPKIEFTKAGGLLPIGLNHQIGIGYSSTQIKEKDYIYRITYGEEYLSPSDSANFEKKLVNYNQKYKGFTLMYAFNIRTPITKNLMINYGVRYSVNIRSYGQLYSGTSNYFQSASDIAQRIGRTRLTSMINFNLGLTYAF